MSSVCLSCILYTLDDKIVDNNKYINIFMLWLNRLSKSNALGTNDIIQVNIDQKSFDYIKNRHVSYNHIINTIPLKFFIEPSPKTHLEGMMWKYIIRPYTQDIYFYSDIDVLILKPLKTLTQDMEKNKIYVMKEGSMLDPNYSAAFPQSQQLAFKSSDSGYSAGKFVITSPEVRNIIFTEINSRCKYDTNYYTIDQPYFNTIIYELKNTPLLDTQIFSPPIVSFNGQHYNKDHTILFDLAGEPGNDSCHFIKYIDVMFLFGL